MYVPRFLLVSILSALFVVACGDDGTVTTDSGTPDGSMGDGGGDGGTDNGILYDDVFSDPCLDSSDSCPFMNTRSACVCVRDPDPDATFATNRVGCSELPTEGGVPRTQADDDCDPSAANGAPDLSCMMESGYLTTGDTQMVTLYGVTDVFGNGGDANGIVVEVYQEGPDGDLGPLLGMATSDTSSDCAKTETEYDNDMPIGTRDLGFYSIENIPTETPLIIKTSGAADFWRELYTYNVQILNDEVEDGAAGEACGDQPAGPRYSYDANVLSRSDYNSIPLTAGLPSGITSGNGAVAGEIHDCANIRLEFAQVGVYPEPVTLVYFNDNPSNPLPVMGRSEGTSLLGLYAALDVPAGPVQVAAVGSVDGASVSLGWYRARVFPNAVTSITLRGLRSQQVP